MSFSHDFIKFAALDKFSSFKITSSLEAKDVVNFNLGNVCTYINKFNICTLCNRIYIRIQNFVHNPLANFRDFGQVLGDPEVSSAAVMNLVY